MRKQRASATRHTRCTVSFPRRCRHSRRRHRRRRPQWLRPRPCNCRCCCHRHRSLSSAVDMPAVSRQRCRLSPLVLAVSRQSHPLSSIVGLPAASQVKVYQTQMQVRRTRVRGRRTQVRRTQVRSSGAQVQRRRTQVRSSQIRRTQERPRRTAMKRVHHHRQTCGSIAAPLATEPAQEG